MHTVPIEIIVAYSHNRVIGKDNKLPWHLPNDLQRFKRMTEGHIVFMGRKTWESLPKKPLTNRTNIVISSDPTFTVDDKDVIVVRQVSDFLSYLDQLVANEQHHGKKAFIIGGESIYTLTMSMVSKIHATEINEDIEGDTYFPTLSDRLWKVSHHTEQLHMSTITYEYVTYERY